MLRAYVAADRKSWARWLGEIAFAYNSSTHSSTGYSPNFLLLGYKPQGSTEILIPSKDPSAQPFLPSQEAEEFISAIESHENFARDMLLKAQVKQAKAYNKGRRPVEKIKEEDCTLVNPYTLKLVDSQGLGAKLIQRMIGPFEVMECINPLVYYLRLPNTYPMHPIFKLEHLRKYK